MCGFGNSRNMLGAKDRRCEKRTLLMYSQWGGLGGTDFLRDYCEVIYLPRTEDSPLLKSRSKWMLFLKSIQLNSETPYTLTSMGIVSWLHRIPRERLCLPRCSHKPTQKFQ